MDSLKLLLFPLSRFNDSSALCALAEKMLMPATSSMCSCAPAASPKAHTKIDREVQKSSGLFMLEGYGKQAAGVPWHGFEERLGID
jgi:hypothetical protein